MKQSTELVTTASFSAGKRKLTAVKACAERDSDTLIALINAYLSHRGKKGSKTSEATRRTYETGLLRWIVFGWPDPEPNSSPKVPLLRATTDDVEMFVAARLDAGNREATVSSYLSAARTFYKALVCAKAIEASPADEVRSPTDPRPRWERNSVVAMADASGPYGSVLLLGYVSGVLIPCRRTRSVVPRPECQGL
ncbi:MAG: hypothetical protein AVDCRST_MAG93-1172 [uncultured Chloroflexia bacterium]|uniref:Core-binding (CB) domain-containing protein n=1 Tax=uncultured Chloroflexia bacterium TaxID=1672391 RepID=A0A6J4I1R0_9CHLR|nr:MAG: hypothetical protein AVDCRST_MAG93-1172 [uncultured Chloroflexia bacterium]